MEHNSIRGFSKLNRIQKINRLIQSSNLDNSIVSLLNSFELPDSELQTIIAELSENQLSNFHLPFSVAPNFLIDDKLMFFPLVTEESSVVAAMSKAAIFWSKRGGFHSEVIGTKKKGQLHFCWKGNPEKLRNIFPEMKDYLLQEAMPLTQNMKKRGGGIIQISLNHLPELLPDYYQLDVTFETCNAMGANFINSCLEQFGKSLQKFVRQSKSFPNDEAKVEIIMAILSNYVPDSRVTVWLTCPVEELDNDPEQAHLFADKFVRAVHIAKNDVSRAVTHNKGIFNGIDSLAIATGNDYRAIEAGAHAYACKAGAYRSLTDAKIENGLFWFGIEIPIAVGVVGGVTNIHPLAKLAIKILKNPSAEQLMIYIAVAGLASNWSAIKALVTTGIQQGHMKMHLSNILSGFNISDEQKQLVKLYFQNRDVSFSEVKKFLNENADR